MGLVISSRELDNVNNVDEEHRIEIAGTVVLLVEDNWAHQMVMARRFTLLGCEVVKALNGRDAINILKKRGREENVDMIFMDIQMPLLVPPPPSLCPNCG